MNIFFATVDLEQQITSIGFKTVVISSVILFVCTVIALLFQKRKKLFKKLKKPLFIVMAGTMVISAGTLLAGTVYLNSKAESKGPVHWHAEIEFWSCGAELDLRNPTGKLSNKVGTSTYHEHNDKHIHLEGVVVKKSHDASLGKFMQVTGGYIQDDRIGIPLNNDSNKWFTSEADDNTDGDPQRSENFNLATNSNEWVTNDDKGKILELQNGQSCSGSEEENAELQVFAYTYDKVSKTYSQRKLTNPAEYVIRDESSLGPPSDCIIVEFDTPRDRTDKLCQQYGVKDAVRCVQFGVKEYKPDLCNIRETTDGGNQ